MDPAFDDASPMDSASTSRGNREATKPRRKRGDTIRASDYPRPPIVLLPATKTVNSTTTEPPAARARTTTRRTRSGTVTQADPAVQASASAVGSSVNSKRSAAQTGPSKLTRTRTEVKKHKRRSQVLVKPTLFDAPPPPADDEDDELLLTDDSWKDCQ